MTALATSKRVVKNDAASKWEGEKLENKQSNLINTSGAGSRIAPRS